MKVRTRVSVVQDFRSKDSLLVGTVYRSPNSSKENDAVVNELLVKMSVGRSHILVVSDFQPYSTDVG